MCFLAVKKFSLEKRLVKLEQEVKSLKTEQGYGLVQSKVFLSNEVSGSSIASPTPSGDRYGLHLRVRLNGDYADKSVIGEPVIVINTSNNNCRVVYDMSSSGKGYLRVDIYAVDQFIPVPFSGETWYSTPFSLGVRIKSNQPGQAVIELEEAQETDVW